MKGDVSIANKHENMLSSYSIREMEIKTIMESLKHQHEQHFSGCVSLDKGNKAKVNKQDYIKLKSLCAAKDTINKTKRHPTVWENIFING